jgi:hypothetical protein
MTGKPRSQQRCGSPTKTTGAPCKRPIYPGSHRCVMHSGPLTAQGRQNSLDALIKGRETVLRNHAMKLRAKEAARQWMADFAPESPLVDALVDSAHAAHAGAVAHAKSLLTEMRNV